MNFVKSFDFFGVPASQIPCIPGSGAPTTATEGAVGCLYMDTDTGDLYKCTVADGGVYTWTKCKSDGTVKTVNGQTPDENGNVEITIPESGQNVALTTEQINALDNMFKVCAFIKEDVSAEYAAFQTAFGISGGEEEPDEPVNPEVTLTSISAVYDGGDVAVGTAVTDLTGIVVTAYYSDGSQQNVTEYTLSGTIAEGSNTVTVTYQGKTATLAVTGVAESGGEETGVSNETTWTDGVAYTFTHVDNEYVETDGKITPYNNWDRTPYLYCSGASKLRVVINKASSMVSMNNNYNAFYDADKNFVSAFSFSGIDANTTGAYMDVEIPNNAVYFIASHKNEFYRYLGYVPYA